MICLYYKNDKLTFYSMNDMIEHVISNGYPIFYSIEDIDSDIEYVKLAKDMNDFLGDRSLIKLKWRNHL